MKKIIAIVFASFSVLTSVAQVEFSHSAGLTYIMGIYKYTALQQEVIANGYDDSGTYTLGYPGLTYNPRLDLVLKEEMSISLTAYPTLAFSGSANSREGASGTFAAELPMVAQLNMGHHASDRARKNFGFYVGGGYNVGGYSGVGMVHGPTAQAGIRFKAADLSYTIRAFGTLPLNMQSNEKLTLLGGGVLINLDYKAYKIYK